MTATTASRRARRIASFVIGLALVLLLLEFAARGVESSGADALRWYDASTQLRVEQMAASDDVEVVFAGTSMAWQGLVPAVWTANDTEGRGAFNVGMAGGVPEVMEPWLLDVVQPELHPDLVVWGLSSLDFSISYGADNVARYRDALETREGALAEIERIAARYSALVRYRNVLRDPSEWGETRGFDEATSILGVDGERRDFVVDASAERRRQVEARLANFTLDPTDIEAIHRTVVQLRDAGTDVVFVQMPIPERYVELHPGGPDDVAATRQAIVRLGEVLDVEVIDATSGFADLDFVDFTHLNERSAAALTEQVARQISGAELVAVEAIISDAELMAIANDLVAIADLTRSAMTQSGSLPSSSELWNTSIEYGHTRDLWAYEAQGRNFHTIFAGSSMVYAGLDPAVFTQETGLTAYNIGLPSAGPEEVDAFLDNVVFPTVDPQQIVFGIAPRDFVAIEPGQSCADPLTGYSATRAINQGVFGAVDWFATVPAEQLLFSSPVTHEPVRAVPMHERYRNAFSLLGDRTHYPTKGPKQLAKEAETLRERQSQYVFCQQRLDALSALVSDLDGQGIKVVIVGMPTSTFRVDPLPGGRSQMEQIMSDAETAVMAAGAHSYLDFTVLLDDDQFYDYTHTDLAASHQLTRALAQALAAG